MKKVLSIALLALLALTLCMGCQPKADANKLEKILAEGKITMATSPDFAPMEFMDPTKTGQEAYVGSDVQLGRYIAEKLGVQIGAAEERVAALRARERAGNIAAARSTHVARARKRARSNCAAPCSPWTSGCSTTCEPRLSPVTPPTDL